MSKQAHCRAVHRRGCRGRCRRCRRRGGRSRRGAGWSCRARARAGEWCRGAVRRLRTASCSDCSVRVRRFGRLERVDAERQHLERTLTLRGAVTLNLLDMIGVGPFITLPLLIGAMGGPQAMVGWVLGALLAACDGHGVGGAGRGDAGGGRDVCVSGADVSGACGRWLSFLFAFQLCCRRR